MTESREIVLVFKSEAQACAGLALEEIDPNVVLALAIYNEFRWIRLNWLDEEFVLHVEDDVLFLAMAMREATGQWVRHHVYLGDGALEIDTHETARGSLEIQTRSARMAVSAFVQTKRAAMPRHEYLARWRSLAEQMLEQIGRADRGV